MTKHESEHRHNERINSLIVDIKQKLHWNLEDLIDDLKLLEDLWWKLEDGDEEVKEEFDETIENVNESFVDLGIDYNKLGGSYKEDAEILQDVLDKLTEEEEEED